MKKKLIATCALLTVLMGGIAGTVAVRAAQTTAAATLGEEPGPLKLFFSGEMGRLLTLRSELDLSVDQKDQIKTILQKHRVEIATALKPIVAKRRALHEAVAADSPDEKAIRTAAQDMASSIGDAAILASKVRAEIFQVLMPEQRQKIDTFRKEHYQSVDHILDRLAS